MQHRRETADGDKLKVCNVHYLIVHLIVQYLVVHVCNCAIFDCVVFNCAMFNCKIFYCGGVQLLVETVCICAIVHYAVSQIGVEGDRGRGIADDKHLYPAQADVRKIVYHF